MYGIYDNDELIFKGSSNEVADMFNLQNASLYTYYSKGIKIKGKYAVKKLEYIKPVKPSVTIIKKNKHQQTLEYLISHLERYGNVYSKENPESYIDELNSQGYKVKVNEYITVQDDFVINCPTSNRKRKKSIDYVITSIKE